MDGADLSNVMHCLGTNGVIVTAIRYSHCHAQSEDRSILTNVMDALGMNTAVLTTYWV